MYKNNLEVVEYVKWNRKILNIYWIVAAIAIITETVIFFSIIIPRGDGNFHYLMMYVIRPGLFNVILLTATELIHMLIKNKYKEAIKYLIIVCATLLVSNMVYVHYAVAVIFVLFIFPIFLSVFYASKRLTYFTMVLNLVCYLLVYFVYLPTRPSTAYRHNFMDFCTTVAFIFSTVALVSSFIGRFKELMASLLKVHESEQELAIKNFVMEFNSKIEPATGLYNHKTFYEYLDYLIAQSENFGFRLSLAVLDIDNFKRVNDTYGHSLGDEVIKALSEIIKSSIGTDDYAARYGGEEFAVIFTDKSKEQVFDVMEEVRRKFNELVIKEMENERFGISIGVSEHTKGMTRQVFFANTDSAQYQAKKSGKNKTIIYK